MLTDFWMRVVILLLFFFLHPPPPESCSQWEISEALLKCGHRGWCNQAFKNRERGRNNGVGWWLGGIFGTFFAAGLLAQESDCWGLGSGCYAWCCFSLCLFGYNSPEQDDVIQRDLWTFLIKRQNHGGEPNYAAGVWTGHGAIPLLILKRVGSVDFSKWKLTSIF